jgi:hypothetical protein
MAEYPSAAYQIMPLSLWLSCMQYSWQQKSLKPLIETNILILVDSISCIQAMENCNWSNPNILAILIKLHHLVSSGISITFMCIPSHIGIRGNTAADTAAKLALSSAITDCKVPYLDFKSLINKYIISQWQESWNQETSN